MAALTIVVCVKQVPVASELRFDPDRRTAVREGVPLTINAFDRRAVTEALRLAGDSGGQVAAVTMGPPAAREALVECLALGCQRAIHVCDPALAGSDSLITARVLAAVLRRLPFDLVFCGRWSVDAETGQVGPELAELLDLPQVTGVSAVRPVQDDPLLLQVQRETDDGLEELDVRLPALLTAAERLVRPASPSEAALALARERPIEDLTTADLGFAPADVGLAASPTRVGEIRVLAVQRERRLLSGSPAELAEQLAEELERRGLLQPRPTASAPSARSAPVPRRYHPDGPAIWVVADLLTGALRRATLELLGKGAELAERLDGTLAAVLLGGPEVTAHVPALASHGAARVYLGADPRLAVYHTEPYAEALSRAIHAHMPRAVLFSASATGRDLAPRVAARLGLGLTADCIDLDLDAEGRLVQLKPAFGGLVVAPILTSTRPELATVRPGLFPLPTPDPDLAPKALSLDLVDLPAPRAVVTQSWPEAGLAGVALDDARAIVCVGMGLGGADRLPLAQDLTRVLGGVVAGTRKVVDHGWLPRQQQVGLTGRAVAPALYVAVGLRGSFNHSVGIQRAGTIVAINNDPTAEIFQTADLALVTDAAPFLPLLIAALERRRGRPARGGYTL